MMKVVLSLAAILILILLSRDGYAVPMKREGEEYEDYVSKRLKPEEGSTPALLYFVSSDEVWFPITLNAALNSNVLRNIVKERNEMPGHFHINFPHSGVHDVVFCMEYMVRYEDFCDFSKWSLQAIVDALHVVHYLEVMDLRDALIARAQSLMLKSTLNPVLSAHDNLIAALMADSQLSKSIATRFTCEDPVGQRLLPFLRGFVTTFFDSFFKIVPCLHGVESLVLKDNYTIGQSSSIAKMVSESSSLSHLMRLDFSGNFVGVEGARLLANSPYLSRLNYLDLSHSGIEYEGAKTILMSPFLQNLKELYLGITNFGVLEAIQLPIRPHLERLGLTVRSISLSECNAISESSFLSERLRLSLTSDFSSSQVTLLASSPCLKNIENVDFIMKHLLKEKQIPVFLSFLNAPHLKHLTSLDLSESEMEDDLLIAILNSPNVESVQILDLEDNRITSRGLAAIAQSPFMKNLVSLTIHDNRIDDQGLIAIATSPLMNRLERLVMDMNQFTDIGVQALANSEFMSNLSYLNLGFNNLSDESAFAIAESQYFRKLDALQFDSCPVTDVGALALASSPNYQWTWLALADSDVSEIMKKHLESLYPVISF